MQKNEFRRYRDGDYIGERCPDCDSELRLGRLRRKRLVLWCSCGYECLAVGYIEDMKVNEEYWLSQYKSQFWPEPRRDRSPELDFVHGEVVEPLWDEPA